MLIELSTLRLIVQAVRERERVRQKTERETKRVRAHKKSKMHTHTRKHTGMCCMWCVGQHLINTNFHLYVLITVDLIFR